MNILDLMAVKAKADSLSLDSSVDDLMPLFRLFGVEDPALVGQVQVAAQAVAANPQGTISAFVQSGGLVKLLAGPQAGNTDGDELEGISCPHCKNHIFL